MANLPVEIQHGMLTWCTKDPPKKQGCQEELDHLVTSLPRKIALRILAERCGHADDTLKKFCLKVVANDAVKKAIEMQMARVLKETGVKITAARNRASHWYNELWDLKHKLAKTRHDNCLMGSKEVSETTAQQAVNKVMKKLLATNIRHQHLIAINQEWHTLCQEVST